MRDLLAAIDEAGRPLTPVELAARTGLAVGDVRALLDALRANGRLAPQGSDETTPSACAIGPSCGSSCPGSGECPLVIDLDLGGLSPR